MKHTPFTFAPRWLLVIATTLGLASAAVAAGNGRAIALLPKYQQECASCHLAFPPTLMPAASWGRIMGNLPQHFGTDASLDAATQKELTDWIYAHAGTYKRVAEEPPQDRITRTVWFVRKHNEVSAATWKLPAVKSAANCAACHITAEKGDFDERNIRTPR
jgi:nitrate/TMAO reductase-like tetraheme cytochrome c subunit